MIHKIDTQPTFAQAWLAAATYLHEDLKPQREAYNLILEIENSGKFTEIDRRICRVVDAFLKRHGSQPINTVAGTIFPAGFYVSDGADGVYEKYPEMYPKIEDGWGRYAMRMLRRQGKDGKEINPLKLLVEKLKRRVQSSRRYKSVYELGVIDVALDLTTYDPADDANRCRMNPCLSHLSFKLLPDNKLGLSVMYRYHYYIEKALGNFLGLAQLQNFVATETELTPGPLTCLSTYSVIDISPGRNIGAITKMLKKANSEKCRANAA